MGLILPRNCSKANFAHAWYEAHRCAIIHCETTGCRKACNLDSTYRAWQCTPRFLAAYVLQVHKELSVSKRRTSKTPFLWSPASLPFFPGTKHKTKNLSWSETE